MYDYIIAYERIRNMRKTKIVATLGPATDGEGILKELLLAGVNVVRFNMSHGDYETHKARFEAVRKTAKELDKIIGILMDTKGPEIRTGLFDGKVEIEGGSRYTLTTRDVMGNEGICSITYKDLPGEISEGQRVLIDDGKIEMKVVKVVDTEIICDVINGGTISSNKGINCPGLHLMMPYVSERDKADLRFGKEMGFDFIAASFARSAQDINILREELKLIGWNDVRIIAKIENAEGVRNIDEIIEAADGVMVARGDMGVEIDLEEIPILQKMIIKKTVSAGKQVITATQMLESMVKNPRPTRAETTDVANAIYDGTSAIMLSGETAAGSWPVEAVRTMAAIAERTEKDIDYDGRFFKIVKHYGDITAAISHSTVLTANDLGAKAIVTVTKKGFTARMLSRFRPMCPIIGCSPDEKVCYQMSMSWGVYPALAEEVETTDELFGVAVDAALESGFVESGDKIVITAGVPIGKSGTTNLIKVETV